MMPLCSLSGFCCLFTNRSTKALKDKNGNIIKCRFIRPKEEGIESVIKIDDEKDKTKKKISKKK